MAEEKPSFEITRRTVIASATLVPVTALTASAQSPPAALTAAQRQILEAFVDRLCPKDDLGAGAVECGAANYIDQQLAGYLSSEKEAMVAGLAAVDAYARNSQNRRHISARSGADHDQVVGHQPHTSNSSRVGSSIRSFTATRKRTACSPSIRRWS